MFDASRTIAFAEVKEKLEKHFSETNLEDLELLWKDEGRIFYEFDWVTWLKFWVLSQAETIITNVFTLAKLSQHHYTVYPKKKIPDYLLNV